MALNLGSFNPLDVVPGMPLIIGGLEGLRSLVAPKKGEKGGKDALINQPLLKPVQPARRRRRRSSDPFDFFGTLFVDPATQGIDPISSMNRTV